MASTANRSADHPASDVEAREATTAMEHHVVRLVSGLRALPAENVSRAAVEACLDEVKRAPDGVVAPRLLELLSESPRWGLVGGARELVVEAVIERGYPGALALDPKDVVLVRRRRPRRPWTHWVLGLAILSPVLAASLWASRPRTASPEPAPSQVVAGTSSPTPRQRPGPASLADSPSARWATRLTEAWKRNQQRLSVFRERLQHGDLEGARAAVEACVDEDPSHTDCLAALIECWRARAVLDEAAGRRALAAGTAVSLAERFLLIAPAGAKGLDLALLVLAENGRGSYRDPLVEGLATLEDQHVRDGEACLRRDDASWPCLLELGSVWARRARRTHHAADVRQASLWFQRAVEAAPPDAPGLAEARAWLEAAPPID